MKLRRCLLSKTTVLVAVLLLVFGTGVLFGMPQKETVKKKGITIAYLPPNLEKADFYGQYYNGLIDGLKSLKIDYNIVERVPSTHDGHAEQLAIVEDVISLGVDYIVMAPTHYEGQQTAYRTINEAGVPLFIFNYSDPFPAEFGAKALSYVGYKHSDAGKVLADYILDKYPAGTKIAIIYGTPTQISYDRAAKEQLIAGGMNIIFEHYANWQRDQAYDATTRLLTSRSDVEVIIGVSSFTAMGAVRAAADSGVLDNIDIYGAGAILEELDAIAAGQLNGAWYRDPTKMGQETAKFIKLHMDGKKDQIPESYNVPIVMIDSVKDIHDFINPITYSAVGKEMPPLK